MRRPLEVEDLMEDARCGYSLVTEQNLGSVVSMFRVSAGQITVPVGEVIECGDSCLFVRSCTAMQPVMQSLPATVGLTPTVAGGAR